MGLGVENINKFVCRKKKSRENIETYLKSYYNIQLSELNWYNYINFVKYKDVEELKSMVYEIFRYIENEDSLKNCFTEAEATFDELDLIW